MAWLSSPDTLKKVRNYVQRSTYNLVPLQSAVEQNEALQGRGKKSPRHVSPRSPVRRISPIPSTSTQQDSPQPSTSRHRNTPSPVASMDSVYTFSSDSSTGNKSPLRDEVSDDDQISVPHNLRTRPSRSFHDPFKGGIHIVHEGNGYVMTVSQRDFAENIKWHVDDRIFTVKVRSTEKDGSHPLISDVLKGFDYCVKEVVSQLQNAYENEYELHQIYVTISEHGTHLIVHGLNTGRFALEGPPADVAETTVSILQNYLRSNEKLDLENGINIDFTILGIPHVIAKKHRARIGKWKRKWRPRPVVMGFSTSWDYIPAWLVKTPEGTDKEPHLFTTSCLLFSLFLGLLDERMDENGRLRCIQSYKKFSDVRKLLLRRQRMKNIEKRKLLPKRVGVKIWKALEIFATKLGVPVIGPHILKEVITTFCNTFGLNCIVYNALNPREKNFICRPNKDAPTISLLEEDGNPVNHVDFISKLSSMQRCYGQQCDKCGKSSFRIDHQCIMSNYCKICKRTLKECGPSPFRGPECSQCACRTKNLLCGQIHELFCNKYGLRCKKCDQWLHFPQKKTEDEILEAHAPLCSKNVCYKCWLHKKELIGEHHVCFLRQTSLPQRWGHVGVLTLKKDREGNIFAGGITLEGQEDEIFSLCSFHPILRKEDVIISDGTPCTSSLPVGNFGYPVNDRGLCQKFVKKVQDNRGASVAEKLLACILSIASNYNILVDEKEDLNLLLCAMDRHCLEPLVENRGAPVSRITFLPRNVKFSLRSNHLGGEIETLRRIHCPDDLFHWFPDS